jgi:decaprenylphospho-beta-D-ribofuranose 2-oxidase
MTQASSNGDGAKITDWGRIESAQVSRIVSVRSEDQLAQTVADAARCGSSVSVRGIAHSAGGQSFCPRAVVLDMRQFNKVLGLDTAACTIRVQSGATWGDITPLLESHGLSVTTKQEFDTFTIGGSLAANVHGKSVDYGPLIEAVDSFRLVKPDGIIISVSPSENAELFSGVLGGFGMLGPIVDATLKLVRDRVVRKCEIARMNLSELCRSYIQRIQAGGNCPPVCYGFLTPDCTRGFYVTYEYVESDGDWRPKGDALQRDEVKPLIFDVFIELQRRSSWVRNRSLDIMWMTGGGAEETLRSRRLLLWDRPPRVFQGMLLQKYFVPKDCFVDFARSAGRIFDKYPDLALAANHFRWVPGSAKALLAAAPEDSICMIPCYLARKGDARWTERLRNATHELLNAALELGGRQYLAFDIFANCEQFRRGYKRSPEFLALKRRHDPDVRFSSMLYEKFGRAAST